MRLGDFQDSPRVLLGIRKRAPATGNAGPGAGGKQELPRPVPSLRAVQNPLQPAIGLVEAVGELERPDPAVGPPETVNGRPISRQPRPVRPRNPLCRWGAGGPSRACTEAPEAERSGRPRT